MKKILCLLLALTMLLSLAACGGGGNTLFEAAAPNQSVLTFFTFDGESGWYDWISDTAKEQEILEELAGVKAKKVENWSADKAAYPMYGLSIGTADGMGLHMLWTNGYLITRHGEVYEFDYDFAKAMEGLEWGSESSREMNMASRVAIRHVSAMPNSYYLALEEGKWNADYLQPADELSPPEGISMSLKEWTADAVSVSLSNETDAEWMYGEYFSLQVKLDGDWYTVPATPDNNWAFTDIGIILMPHDENEKTYNLSMYGDLPAGTYRLVVEGLSVEQEIS